MPRPGYKVNRTFGFCGDNLTVTDILKFDDFPKIRDCKC